MTRQEAEKILSKELVGNFIIRSGTKRLTLSAKTSKKILHLIIYEVDSGFTIDKSMIFDSILHLVNYYKTYPVAHDTKLVDILI